MKLLPTLISLSLMIFSKAQLIEKDLGRCDSLNSVYVDDDPGVGKPPGEGGTWPTGITNEDDCFNACVTQNPDCQFAYYLPTQSTLCRFFILCAYSEAADNSLAYKNSSDVTAFEGGICTETPITTISSVANVTVCEDQCLSEPTCTHFGTEYISSGVFNCNTYNGCTVTTDTHSMVFTRSPPPTPAPTNAPSTSPTKAPTGSPTEAPTGSPTTSPTKGPTGSPTKAPTGAPTSSPSAAPTSSPVAGTPAPTTSPSATPTSSPVAGTPAPTTSPSAAPTSSPVAPTPEPTNAPSTSPTPEPTTSPVATTPEPTSAPTTSPIPTPEPTNAPTSAPTDSSDVFVVATSEVIFNVKDSSAREQSALTIISDLKGTVDNPSELSFHLASTETSTIPMAVYDEVNDQSLITQSFEKARGCYPDCTATITYVGNQQNRRVLQFNDYVTIEIQFELTESAYNDLVASGNNLDDPAFLSELSSELGVLTSNLTVSIVGGEIVLEVSLLAASTNDPTGTETIDQLQELQDSLNNATHVIVEELGEPSDSVTTVELDLCGDRDCNGRGDSNAEGTNNNGCVIETGVCACVGNWWGINCESACACDNGGVCRDALCHCPYPYYGETCENFKNCTVCF